MVVVKHELVEASEAKSVIRELRAPNIVLWYIGSVGLQYSCMRWYRQHVIEPWTQQQPAIHWWLVDLTAWAALKHRQVKLDCRSKFVDLINDLGYEQLTMLSAASLFEKMKVVTNDRIIKRFESVSTEEALLSLSKDMPLNDMKLREVFSPSPPILNHLRHLDTAQAYAPLQYLEGLMIVEHILATHQKERDGLEIVFALPNDEWKYYFPTEQSFEDDIPLLLNDSKVEVHFLPICYGQSRLQRPYNAPGRRVKTREMSLASVIGDCLCMQ